MDVPIEIAWEMDIGEEGTDEDPYNPLCRSVDRLFQTGQPLHKTAICFCSFPRQQQESTIPRWFGAFVFSAGDRLLFFPGFADMTFTMTGKHGRMGEGIRKAMWDKPVCPDHISLEKDRTSWHATTTGSKNHFGGPRTIDLGDGRILWFGMSVADETALRVAKKRTLIRARVPQSDAQRRNDIFVKAREAETFPLVAAPVADQPASYFFCHFSVIVGPVGFTPYQGREHAFPIDSPFLLTPFPKGFSVATVFRCTLAPFCDVHITAMRVPGLLSVPLHFTSGGPERPQIG